MSFWDQMRASKGAGDLGAQALGLIEQGNAREDAGEYDAALRLYDEAIACQPSLPRAHLNRGNVLLLRGDAAGAMDAYGAALARQADYAPAHYGIGNALSVQRSLPQAAAAYAQAIDIQPDFVDAHVALANIQEDLMQLEESAASYSRALALRPDYAQVYYNLSNVQRKLGLLDAAEHSCREALRLQPGLAEASNNLGVLLAEQKRMPEALAMFGHAVQLRPEFGGAVLQRYRCASQLCDWSHRATDERQLARLVARATPEIPPFALLTMDEPRGEAAAMLQREAGLAYARGRWATLLERPAPAPMPPPAADRLCIGYASADFHEHATMHLLRGVLAAHDRSRFRIHAYSYGDVADDMTQQARQACDVWRDVRGLPEAQAAAAIAADGTHILVDLKGYTHETRMEIVARRPAPVVVSWLGYPGTLGHPAMADYIVGDPVVTPLGHAAHFSETLALLPHCYQPNDREKAIGPRPSRAEAGLPPTGFVFCSFNGSGKFNPGMLALWCRLLREVPASVLWLLQPHPVAADNLRQAARGHGIDERRFVFAPGLPLAQHLGRLQLADLALDTFPYTSHTTGSDVLWAGVPLVTLQGTTFASRVASSLLHAVGLPELVTHSGEDYFSLAKSLALDPARLSALRDRLAQHRMSHPLFDTPRFTRDLERLYTRMWEQHAAGCREPIVLGG